MLITCPGCGEPLRPEQYNNDSQCTQCSAPLLCTAYPALVRDKEIAHAEHIGDEKQASCFYHPAKQAIVDCGHCGRFLCALCDLEMGDVHICPACLSRGKDQHNVLEQKQGRVRYDMLALVLAFWPLLLFLPFAVISAPVALYLTLRHYKTPLSLTTVTRWRFPVAALLAIAQLVGIGWGTYFLISL
ncbi:MAG: hypothetical protein SD837_21220 [Candidatus Electrothrix scaldis]|nr:MAG: hypothetical protein SD837_21220 [Candidatus Electrothrix sp. GW3-3]